MNDNLRAIALAAYAAARASGLDHDQAAVTAWAAVRLAPQGRRLRAPNWREAFHANGGTRKSYRMPLAELLFGPRFIDLGSHSAKYPRTKQSKQAMVEAAADFECRINSA